MPVMHEVWQFWLVQHDHTADIMPVMPGLAILASAA